jgi:hypothetical protein
VYGTFDGSDVSTFTAISYVTLSRHVVIPAENLFRYFLYPE